MILVFVNIFAIFLLIINTLYLERSCIRELIFLNPRVSHVLVVHQYLSLCESDVIVVSWAAIIRVWVLTLTVNYLCSALVLHIALHVAHELYLVLPLSERGRKFPRFVTEDRGYASLENYLMIRLAHHTFWLLTWGCLVFVDPTCLCNDLNAWPLIKAIEFPFLEIPAFLIFSEEFQVRCYDLCPASMV
jgi:hypothetical protein